MRTNILIIKRNAKKLRLMLGGHSLRNSLKRTGVNLNIQINLNIGNVEFQITNEEVEKLS